MKKLRMINRISAGVNWGNETPVSYNIIWEADHMCSGSGCFSVRNLPVFPIWALTSLSKGINSPSNLYNLSFAGGRGKDGAPIITFPEFAGFSEIPDEDFLNVVTYLTSIPRWDKAFLPQWLTAFSGATSIYQWLCIHPVSMKLFYVQETLGTTCIILMGKKAPRKTRFSVQGLNRVERGIDLNSSSKEQIKREGMGVVCENSEGYWM